MPDPMKKFIKHMDGINAAREYDAAAKAMAEHCDKRIERVRRILTKIRTHVYGARAGTAAYAQDRLNQIEKLANLGLEI